VCFDAAFVLVRIKEPGENKLSHVFPQQVPHPKLGRHNPSQVFRCQPQISVSVPLFPASLSFR